MLIKKARFILLITAVLTLSAACTKSEATDEKKSTEAPQIAEVTSKIFVSIDMEEFTEAKKGDEISVSIQDGSVYTLRINRMEETMPGIVSISADIENKETGQAILILRDGKLTGSINMYGDGVSYKLDYDTEAKQHFITLIDPATKDVLKGGEPLKATSEG